MVVQSNGENAPTLLKLGESELALADPAQDIRGMRVIDRDGEDLGKVHGLLIDPDERRVRFLEVAGGGFLGIGDRTVLVPVDAIAGIDDDTVNVDQTGAHVGGGADYDPALTDDPNYWTGYYSYYGLAPFWAGGYTYPVLTRD